MSERGDFVVDVDLQVNDATIANLGEQVRRKTEPATESLNAASRAAAATRKQMDALASSGRKLANTLTPAGREAHDLAVALMEIGQGQQVIAQGFKNLQTELTKQRTVQRQYLIAQREDADRARQADFESQRAANSRLAIEQQRAAQSQLIRQRQTGQQRIQIARAVFENLGRFEKGFGAAIAGTARTATSAIGRAFDTLTSRIRNTNRVFTEGTQTSLSRREGLIRGSFTRQERLVSESVTRQQRTIQRLNTSLSTGVTGALTGRGLGVGLAGIGGGIGFAGLLSSGFERFSNLERINKQFLALTGNIDATNMLLEQVKEFAKTTPFDLVGVADLAKGFLAIGTSAEDVIPRVQAIADAVALTGGGVDELNRIQRAIGQVVSAGRLQGDELNQLAENLPGLNIRQILADQLTNGNVRTLVEMQEAGEITSDLFVTGLINGLQSDRRLVGASQDLANTLSGRVANLKESFADLGAAIIGTVAGPLKSAASTTQTALQGLADFIKGDITGPLLILRSAFKGAAAGVGTLLAAKGASEALRLLAASARLVLTPFGLMLTAAAALGALFNVMYERSPELRMAIGALGDRFGAAGASISEKFAPILAAVATFVSEKVLPAVDRLARFLAANLLDAFDAVSSFITDTAFPAIRSFGEFLIDTVVPALIAAGGFIARAFDTATSAVASFAAVVWPLIQPAIDGFQQLGSAIGAAFGGDFSGLASGAGAAATGIGGALANIGESIGTALAPLGKKIIGGLKDIFTPENLVEVGKAALNVIETIGYVLGNIVSDPRFLTTLAAIAGAAALVALRFAEGVAKGVGENLPELLALAMSGLKKVFSTIISEVLFDPGVLAVAITGALIAPSIIRAFRSFGEQGAAGFAKGFSAKLRSQGDLLSGLFGGARGVQSSASSKFWAQTDREVRQLQTTLRAFGSDTQVAFNPSSIRAAKKELSEMTSGLSDAQIQGVLMRQTFTDAFGALSRGASGVTAGLSTIASAFTGPISRGLSGASAALAEFFSAGTRNATLFKRSGQDAGAAVNLGFRDTLRTGAGQIKAAFSTTLAELQEIARDRGTTIGRFVGSKIASGLAIGLGSFVAGRAEGQAGGSGVLAALTSGLAVTAMTGNAGFGAAAAGISLLGTAFGKAKRAAEQSQKRVEDFSAALKNDLQEGLKIGTDGLLSLTEALASAGIAKQLQENLQDIQGTLLEVGISFEDVMAAFRSGDLSGLLSAITGSDLGFEAQARAIATLEGSYREFGKSVKETNENLQFTGETDRIQRITTEAQRMSALAASYGVAVPVVKAFNDEVSTEITPRFTDAMSDKIDEAKAKTDALNDSIDRIFGNRDPAGLAASLDAAIVAVAGSFDGLVTDGGIVDQAKLDRALEDLRVQLSDVTKAGINEGVIFDEATLRQQTLGVLGAALDGIEDPALRDAIAQVYEDGIANALPTINTQNIYDQLAAGLSEEEVVVPATLDNRALSAEAARLAAQAKQYGTTAGANYGDGLDSGIRQKVEKARRAAAAIAAAVQDTVNNWWDMHSPSKVAMEQGGFYTEGLAIGIGANSAMAAQAAQQAAMSTINSFGGTSVLASAQDAGLTIGQAIANGLADAEADMTSVVSNAVEALLKQISTLGSASKDAATNAAALLFGGITGSDRVGLGGIGAGTTGAGVGAITGSLGSFLSTFDSNVSRIFEVNAKKLGDLTAADREVYGTNVFSLDPNSVFGASNLSAITDFLDNVASLGESLIAQGQPLDQVRTTLEGYIDDLITTASNLGFNRDQLLGLIDQLGLSDAALAEFIKQVDALNAAAAGAPSATPATSSTVDPGADYLTLPRVVYDQTFVVNLPTGDPYAAAVTIANQQAQAAQLPGG